MLSRQRAIRNIIVYGAFALLASWVFVLTASFPQPLLPGYPGSAMFPRFAVGLMGFFSLFGLVREVYRLVRETGQNEAPAEDAAVPVSVSSFAIVVAILIGFVVVTELAGMEVGVFVFTSASLYMVTRKALISALGGISSVVVVYFLFVQALSVFMPLAFLPRYLNW